MVGFMNTRSHSSPATMTRRAVRHKLHLALSLLSLLACLLVPTSAFAAETIQTHTLRTADLQAIFHEIVQSNTPLPPEDLTIENFSSRPETLELPSGAVDYRIISQSAARQSGRQTIHAMILVDSLEAGEVTMNGDILLLGDVICAARPIPRNTILTEEDIEIVRQDISMLGPDFVQTPADAIGKENRTTLRPGAVLYTRTLKAPELVKRGDIVSIVAKSSALRISVPGRVVESTGARGDVVRVKNLMSRREVYATVISSDEVLVDF